MTTKSLVRASLLYLRQECPHLLNATGEKLEAAALLAAMKNGQWPPQTKKEKVRYVVISYAMVCLYGDDVALLQRIKAKLCCEPEPSGLDPARIFVQANYFVEEELKGPKLAQNLFSRYACAVKYLESQKVKPTAELCRSGGVNRWASGFNAVQQQGSESVRPLAEPATFTFIHNGHTTNWSADTQVGRDLIAMLRRRAKQLR